MTRRLRCHRLGLGLAAVLALASATAMADMTKDQCIDANGNGQELRREGKLSAAKESLRACASPSCPAIVRDDCTKRLDELDGAQPGIIFDAKDGAGHDVSLVKVTVDGHPLTEKLDGTALQVDPGERVFVLTMPGKTPVTQAFVIKEGDKRRRERIVLVDAPSRSDRTSGFTPAAAAAFPAVEPDSTRGGLGTRRILGLVGGGFGVAGIAVGSVFGLLTASAISQQKRDCPSRSACAFNQASSDHSTWMRDGTISTVAFVFGGALLAGSAVLFFTGHAPSEPPAAPGLSLVPNVEAGGGQVLVRGAF